MYFKTYFISTLLFSCFFSIIAFGQTTTISKRCGKCLKPVASTSKVGDICPHCGVRWGYENTTTTTTNRNSSTPYLDYYNPSSNNNTKSQSPNSVITKPKPNPFNSYSKEQTEKWLENKLNSYVAKRVSCPEDITMLRYTPCTTDDDYECKLDGTYLIVKFNHDNKYDEIHYLPLYDFSYVKGESYDDEIYISNSSMRVYLPDFNSHKQLQTSLTIGFKNDAEDSLVQKIELALTHLKKFYKKPANSELPDIVFKSDPNKPSILDTKNWILSKLNTYTADRFDVHNSYSSYKITNPSFSFSEFNLIIKYYDISNQIVTVTIPLCECYIGEVGTIYQNDFSGCNYRFYSQKENIVKDDWQGRRTVDFINLKINFNKEDDLFTRLQKAFKNLKSYCPVVAKPKEAF